LFVWLGFVALIDVMPGLSQIIATMVLGGIVVVASWGCTRLVLLLFCLAELEISGWLVLRWGHPPVSS
jgi:hypothetical protein